MDELNLWLKYPLMLKYEEGDVIVYRGAINVDDEDYKIYCTKMKDDLFNFILPEKLAQYQNEISSAIDTLQEKSIITVLDTLVRIIKAKVPSSVPKNYCEIYRHVLYEYSEFTKFYLNIKSCYLAHDLSKIHVSLMDEQNREHTLEISENFDNENQIFKITASDLPEGLESFKESSSLKVIYDQFVKAVDALQPFFNLMDVFDQNCWILDPLEPKRKCTYRRIYLDMDRFPEKTMNIDKGTDILKENGDCSICFCLRLNENLPEIVCKNKFCENYYHIECLYEWLISVNARRFFSEVVGQCPNCEKNISCPIPK